MSRNSTRWLITTLGLSFLVPPALLAQSQANTQLHRPGEPFEIWELKHDTSPPLRDMARWTPPRHNKREAEPVRPIPMPPFPAATAQGDAVIQRQSLVQQFAATTGLNFEGLGNGQYGFTVNSAPPDTDGYVGTTQYVQEVNSSYAIFNKSTGALVAGPFGTNSLWSGFGGGCQSNDDGDGVVLFDKAAQRWVITQFSVSTTPYLECIAVSTTADATGTYNRYSFQYSNFPDYPKLGVWPDGYYMSFNMFNGTTNAFLGSQACVANRTAMLAGTTANQVCFQQGSSVGGLLPSDLDGSTAPPAGSPNYYFTYGTNSLQMYKFHVDWTTTSNSTFTGPTNISVASFTPLCSGGTCVPQPSTTNQLDSLADRLMFRVAYRNYGSHESLAISHSVTGGVRWYEIQNPAGTPTVAQQGTFAPDGSTRWMPSIAMDQAGDLAVGYTVSSSSVFPSVRIAGRVPTDAAGTLETETSIVSGAGSQTGSLTRWGDYSAMTVDPVDDCTFWFTEEYMKTTGSFNWNTRIASFKFPGCGTTGPTASLSPTSLTFGSQTVGSTSAAQAVTLTNSSATALSITSITASGDFAQTNNCGTSVAANSSCTINVTFTPTATGTRTGTLTVTDNASNSPQTASLTGTGASSGTPQATLSPTSLTFGSTNVGTTSAAQAITLTNGGSATLSISGIGISGDFAQTNNCGTSVAAGGSCSISVTFTPTATGTRTGTVTVTDNATGSPQSASLTGTGATGGGGGPQTALYSSTFKAPQCGTVGSSCDSTTALLNGRDTMSGGNETNQPNTINSSCADGTSGTYHSDESIDRVQIATTDGTSFAPGKTVKVSVTVWAYTGYTSDHLDLYYTANASSPTWTAIQTNITPTGAGVQTLTGTFTLPSGSMQAVRANFRYTGSASSCSTGSYDDHDDLVFAVGAAAPDYSLSASPRSVSVTQGGTATSTITVTPVGGFSGSVSLSASGLPAGVTASFNPASTTTTSTLTFTASSTATVGNATVTVTGTSGTTTHTTTIALTVNSPGGGAQTAVYDSTLKAPKCATVGSSCDSGASLLLGRGTMSGGTEVNHPNTINNSCTDGNSGTFHSDESNDRLMIASTDGTALTHGKTAKITATVWAWSTGSSDSLDLYYAANASSPTWVLIGTLKPTAGGQQTLSTTFTLPTGALQAIRANFRYQGTASSCSTGSYDDHDDLVFAAQ